MNKIKNYLKAFFKGNERTIKAKKNILASIAIKGVSVIIGFLMVRVTIDYLDQTKYGIWLTMSSFLTWFTFFEIGLGSGLRNKLTEALAKKNYELGKIYVSTTYAILSIIIGFVAICFLILNSFLDWSKIINTNPSLAPELGILALIVFSFFFLRFIVKLIGIILYADQRPALANSFGPIGNVIVLIIIYVLTKTTNGSLIYLGLTLSSIPVIVLLAVSVFLYNGKYRNISPSIKMVDFSFAKELLSLGIKFFIIQVSALVLFQSSNIIIAQYFGPMEVTSYNIAYKFFGIITMMFSLIMTPYWSAFTDAWVKKEIPWIVNAVKKLQFVFLGFIFFGVFLYFISDWIFLLWIGKENMESIHISNMLRISLLISFLFTSFGGIFNMFINGTGKIKLQMISLLIGAILFFPITIVMITYFELGVTGVVIGSILANFYSPIIAPIQYYKIINDKATGIWNE